MIVLKPLCLNTLGSHFILYSAQGRAFKTYILNINSELLVLMNNKYLPNFFFAAPPRPVADDPPAEEEPFELPTLEEVARATGTLGPQPLGKLLNLMSV